MNMQPVKASPVNPVTDDPDDWVVSDVGFSPSLKAEQERHGDEEIIHRLSFSVKQGITAGGLAGAAADPTFVSALTFMV